MKRFIQAWSLRLIPVLSLVGLFAIGSGCDSGGSSGGGGGGDIGDNNPEVVLAIGDSITAGSVPDGPPYPSRLAGATGKVVINAGSSGERSGGGAARIQGLLDRHHPGTVLILYGANDAIHGADPNAVAGNIGAIVSACRANQSRAIVGTTMPMTGSHAVFNSLVDAYQGPIKSATKNAGGGIVNLYGEFKGSEEALLLGDGLHPNSAGIDVITVSFMERL